jgi:hypothetical protein
LPAYHEARVYRVMIIVMTRRLARTPKACNALPQAT